MTDPDNLLEWFRGTFRDQFEDINGIQDWYVLSSAAIYRKHTGDLDGAIAAMVKSVGLTRSVPKLSEQTAIHLNYLADLYLLKEADDLAEGALRESIALSRPRYPLLLGANLWILAGVQNRKGERREALASAEEARRLYQQHGHPYGVAQAEELIERIKANSG
jgi:hypothetical protein